ncbi:MAG: ABC transporter permease, partial [Clostridium sp.]
IPNIIPSIIVAATLGIGSAIMTESALSYLGMGVAPPNASWGNLIQTVNNFTDLMERPWLWIPPGVCIFLTVMSINLLGDGLRDALDPKLKK